MQKTAQQSLIDILIQIMPALQDARARLVNRGDGVNKQLYSMWSDTGKLSNRKFLKPANLASGELKKMVESGLVEDQGKYLKVTEKGAQALKVMILNDDSFALEKRASKEEITGWYLRVKNADLTFTD
jgi:hypothetical protein